MRGRRPAKLDGVLVIVVVYLLVIALAVMVGRLLPLQSPLAKVALVDLLATLMVFGCSVLCDNSSFYDPYWSVAPIVIVAYWIGVAGFGPRGIVITVLVAVWGCRLSLNFLRHWRGLDHEDWRYAAFRSKAGRLYWLVSLLGFHLFPSVIVFAAMVPVYVAMVASTALNVVDLLAAIVTGTAILIEAFADHQMRGAQESDGSAGRTFRGGLWAYSRHPNYFGEMLLWWGLYAFAVAADPAAWWTAFGPLSVSLLFVAVSVPLMEARMKIRRPDYQRVCKETSILIPWFPGTHSRRPPGED